MYKRQGVERSYGFAKYLHDSLPNATYVGFTGTPVDGTIEVFGPVVDAYTMTEAVKDGITVNPVSYTHLIDFDTKMKTLQSELRELLVAEEKSKADLLTVFKELGYEIEL